MKWLFAVLVTLNLIVFGGMVAYRVTEKQTQNTPAPLEGGTHELARPESLNSRPVAEALPDWVAPPANNDSVPEPESEEAMAAREKAEREAKEKQEKEKKEREEKARREKMAQEKNLAANGSMPSEDKPAARQCTSTASVSLDEDDYHRLKGMLNKWPHAATRSIEKRGSKQAAQPSKAFRVLVPTDGDAMAQLGNLSSKGFSGAIHEGEISVGVTRSKSSAQVLISRLASAGIGGARIVEQEDRSSITEQSLSVARMNVTFMSVNERSIRELQGIVGRYGKLNVRACQ